MSSSSHQNHSNQQNSNNINISCASNSPSNNNNTTFVQLADPSKFRSIVQKLTGSATQDYSSSHPNSGDKGPRRSTFKLHERRHIHSARKLEIFTRNHRLRGNNFHGLNNYGEKVMANSPVSTLEMLTPRSPMEEAEERAIAEKGFYLHPVSPLISTPRGSEPPQLLPLFPLESPNFSRDHSSSS